MTSFLAIGVVGWIAGGLVNYLANTLPRWRKFVHPSCVVCGAKMSWLRTLLWFDNCSSCGSRGSQWHQWRARITQLVFTGAALWMWQSPPPRLGFWTGFLLLIYFGVVIVIDLEHRLILHPVSLAGVGLGLLIGISINGPMDTLFGGLAGFGSMFGIYLLGFLFIHLVSFWRGQKIEEEALGFGDVALSGVLGLMLGWPVIVAGLLMAILLGGLASLLFIVSHLIRRRYLSLVALPYGPFLVASSMFLLYFPSAFLKLLPR
jgi:leader peptidase (prepilin peptidase)/N-methyltransferase